MNAPGNFSLRTVILALLAAAVPAACTPTTAQWSDAQSAKQNKVSFVRLAHEVHFASGPSLSQHEADSLSAFLQRQNVTDSDRVSLIAVEGPQAQQQQRAVAAALKRHGVQPKVALPTEGAAAAPGIVTVVVARYVVTPPPCPDWSRAGTSDPSNNANPNYGCFDAYNLGLMVADPRDLVAGRDMAPADADAATLSIQRYRDGKVTPLTQEIKSLTVAPGGQ